MLARSFAIALAATTLWSGCTAVPAPSSPQRVDGATILQAVFGPPSQTGFGSAVFTERAERPQDLEAAARRCYRQFLGKQWAKAGESVWMAPWRRVYARPPGLRADIVSELRGIQNPAARSAIATMLDGHDKPDAATQALSGVYDVAEMESVEVYTLGDGEALSGVLIAGRTSSGSATLLVFLMD
jgi:hypothetical protein